MTGIDRRRVAISFSLELAEFEARMRYFDAHVLPPGKYDRRRYSAEAILVHENVRRRVPATYLGSSSPVFRKRRRPHRSKRRLTSVQDVR